VTDGALVVVDYVDGVCVQTEQVMRQALLEKIKPVLFINKIDRGILELQVDGEAMYQRFNRVIEDANVTIAQYESNELGNIAPDPTDGSVAFGSALFGWAFTITRFARFYSKKFNIDYKLLMKRLWGDWYHNPTTRKFTQNSDDGKGGQLKRTFVQFIMDPIIKLVKNIMADKKEVVFKMSVHLGITFTNEEKELEGKGLMRCVFKKWIPAADALLEMIIMKLPSPKQAQAYRTSYLYEGPQDDPCAQAMKTCDPEGPTMVYISKMVPQSNQQDRFYAFGRVFSGTVKPGQEVRIMGPNYTVGSKDDLKVAKIQRTVVMMGLTEESFNSIPAGNTVALGGIDKFMTKQATISDFKDAHTIKSMKFAVSAVVRVSVEVKNKTDLPNLLKGLQKLAKADPLVQCYTEETGENIVAGCGELHVRICTKDLETKYAKCPLKFGEPIVSYRESVTSESSKVCLSKSTNKHNRLHCQAEPLGPELTKAIEDEKITAKMSTVQRKAILREEFDWDPNEAQKIWCFGPEGSGPNMLIDTSTGVQYLTEIKDSIESAFHFATKEGAMTSEPVRGVRYNIRDALVHSDNMHRKGSHIMPMVKRAFYGAQLTATPCMQEPVFLCEI